MIAFVDRKAKLDKDEASVISHLEAVLDECASLRSEMTTNQLRMFIQVALHPGLSVGEYGRLLQRDNTPASKELLKLGPKERKDKEGLLLIDQVPDDTDMRVKRYYLTEKGKTFLSAVVKALT